MTGSITGRSPLASADRATASELSRDRKGAVAAVAESPTDVHALVTPMGVVFSAMAGRPLPGDPVPSRDREGAVVPIAAAQPPPAESSGPLSNTLGRFIKLPIFDRRLHRVFGAYATWYLQRHFFAIRVSRAVPLPEDLDGKPLVIYGSHPSWWDPMVALYLARRLFPNRRHYAPIDAQALERYGFFRRLGFYGIDRTSRKGASVFLRTSRRILEEPDAVLWITPQGQFSDVRLRPIRFEAGLGHLAALIAKKHSGNGGIKSRPGRAAPSGPSRDREGAVAAVAEPLANARGSVTPLHVVDSAIDREAPPHRMNAPELSRDREGAVAQPPTHAGQNHMTPLFLPLALDYSFGQERFPEIFLRWGRPISCDETLDSSDWTQRLESALEESLDELAREVITRDRSRFDVLQSGRAGIGVYDIWRRARAWLSGRTFSPGHGEPDL